MSSSSAKKKNLSTKEQAFAEAIVSGRYPTTVEAYRSVYTVGENTQPKTVRDAASRVRLRPGVDAAINRMKARHETERAKSVVGTRNYVLRSLREEAEGETEGATASSRLKAMELLGKSIGLFSDVVETKAREPESQEEIVATLEAILRGDNEG